MENMERIMRSRVIARAAAGLATALVVVASMTPGRASAQVVAGGNTTINSTGAGYLGILQLKCDCTLRVDTEDRFRSFRFRTDPVVMRIESGSPADGRLRPGDYITHIDGERLRSTGGAERFAEIRPGQDVALTIWRDGITSVVRLKASGVSWDDNRVLGTLAPVGPAPGVRLETWDNGAVGVIAAVPATPSPSVRPGAAVRAAAPGVWATTPEVPQEPAEAPPAPRAPRAARAPSVTPAVPARPATPPPGVWAVVPDGRANPSGWFGFSFRCTDCGWARRSDDSNPVWESEEAPELSMISRGGPAERAGLMRGDRLTHIDGYPVTRPEGSRRLGSVKPGQTVRLRVLRDGKPLIRSLTLGERPEARAVAAVAAARPTTSPPRAARELRYTGKIDDVSVEVWSTAGSSVTRVGDTMVITVGATVVRLKVDPAK
jgi:hypothetical protein